MFPISPLKSSSHSLVAPQSVSHSLSGVTFPYTTAFSFSDEHCMQAGASNASESELSGLLLSEYVQLLSDTSSHLFFPAPGYDAKSVPQTSGIVSLFVSIAAVVQSTQSQIGRASCRERV